jgi:hypothetical protein
MMGGEGGMVIEPDKAPALMASLIATLETVAATANKAGEGREVAAAALAPVVLCIGRLSGVKGLAMDTATAVPVVVRTLMQQVPQVVPEGAVGAVRVDV